MITEFKRQTNKTIRQFLRNQVLKKRSYCKEMTNVCPIVEEAPVYFYSTGKETVIVLIDHPKRKMPETANNEDGFMPFYSTTDGIKRESPVWHLKCLMRLYKETLETFELKVPKVWGVLLTSSKITNYTEMQDVWEKTGVTVFDNYEDIEHPGIILSEKCPMLITHQNYVFWLYFQMEEKELRDYISNRHENLRRKPAVSKKVRLFYIIMRYY